MDGPDRSAELYEDEEQLQAHIRQRRERRESLRKRRTDSLLKRLATGVAALLIVLIVLWALPAVSVLSPRVGDLFESSLGGMSNAAATVRGWMPWVAEPPEVRLQAALSRPVFGKPFTLVGRLIPADAPPPRIFIEERKVSGAWARVARVGKVSKGRFSVSVALRETGLIRPRVPGEPAGKALALELRPVLAAGITQTAFWRRPLTLSGRIYPAHAGRRVSLQMKKGSGWWSIEDTTTDAGGGYSFQWKPQVAGEQNYRTLASAEDSMAPAVSGSKKVFAWRMVALTFDDGPSSYTTEILDAFRKDGSKGNFFMLGEMVRESPDLVRRMVREGHCLGNHSLRHRTLTHMSEETLREDLGETNAAIKKACGRAPRWMRPPGGATNDSVNEISLSMGMKVAIWDVTAVDWEGTPSFSAITKRVADQVRPFDIVLMHDGGGDRSQTAMAVPYMLKRLRARGYLPVTLDRLYPGKSAPKPTLPGAR